MNTITTTTTALFNNFIRFSAESYLPYITNPRSVFCDNSRYGTWLDLSKPLDRKLHRKDSFLHISVSHKRTDWYSTSALYFFRCERFYVRLGTCVCMHVCAFAHASTIRVRARLHGRIGFVFTFRTICARACVHACVRTELCARF